MEPGTNPGMELRVCASRCACARPDTYDHRAFLKEPKFGQSGIVRAAGRKQENSAVYLCRRRGVERMNFLFTKIDAAILSSTSSGKESTVESVAPSRMR